MSPQAKLAGVQLLEELAECEHTTGRRIETSRETEWCCFCGAVRLPGSSKWIEPFALRRARELET